MTQTKFSPKAKIDIHLHLSPEGFTHGKLYMEAADKMLPYLLKQNIRKGIVMSGGETELFLGTNAMARAIADADPEHYAWMCNLDAGNQENVYARLLSCREAGAVGIGELVINRPLDDPFLREIFAAAGKLKLPITIHMSPEVGYSYGVVDGPGLPLLEKTLGEYPETVFVGHSAAFWSEISADVGTTVQERQSYGKGPVAPGGRVPFLMEKYPNLYGDLSATSGGNAIMRDEAFGLAFLEKFSHKLMFATDLCNTATSFPLGAWLDHMAAQGKLSTGAYENICWNNAAKLYGL